MSLIELFFLAVGLSMDAFAVAICSGLAMPSFSMKKAIVVGLYFGIFQAGMPTIGYFTATLFADRIIAFDHWIAFALLCFLGGKMIMESLKKDDEKGTKSSSAYGSQSPAQMLPLAVATSIDALAVGVSFAFLRVNVASAVTFIGVTTFIISVAGVKIGGIFGTKYKSKAEFAGGVILALIGLKILLDHFFFVN